MQVRTIFLGCLLCTAALGAQASDPRVSVWQLTPQATDRVAVPQVSPALRSPVTAARTDADADRSAPASGGAEPQGASRATPQIAEGVIDAGSIFDLAARGFSSSEFRLPSVRYGVMVTDRF